MGARPVRYGVRVSSFRGLAIGAIHWYGRAWRYRRAHEDALEQWDVERTVDEATAAEFNLRDRHETWTAGDLTTRFDDRDEVLKAGAALLRARFGAGIRIESGSIVYDDNEIWSEAAGVDA